MGTATIQGQEELQLHTSAQITEIAIVEMQERVFVPPTMDIAIVPMHNTVTVTTTMVIAVVGKHKHVLAAAITEIVVIYLMLFWLGVCATMEETLAIQMACAQVPMPEL